MIMHAYGWMYERASKHSVSCIYDNAVSSCWRHIYFTGTNGLFLGSLLAFQPMYELLTMAIITALHLHAYVL